MRFWTLDEANTALGWVREAVARLRELAHTSADDGARVRGNGERRGTQDTSKELNRVLGEVTDAGIVVRDAPRGLIDFPALAPDGRTYLLCWLDGEDTIEWWHWPEDGFAGRAPITSPPE